MNRRTFLTVSASAYSSITGCIDGLISSRRQKSASTVTEEAIRSNRTTELDVVVLDRTANPIPGASVSVEMQAHDFHFGTAVDAARLLEETENGDLYRSHLMENFNTAVLENRHKWKQWEDTSNRKLADRATRWLLEKELAVRGHTAIWQHFDAGAVPEDVKETFYSCDLNCSDYLHERTMGHVWEIVDHYDGEISNWDIVNEHLDHHRITEAIAPDHPPQESPALVGWFETAKEAAAETDFYYNDYGIITGDEERRRELETLIGYLQKFDAAIDGVGMQGHFSSYDETINSDEFRELLDRLAAFDINVQITEYDTFGDDWTEQKEADHLETVLKTLYSHSAAVGFTTWGFWDGEHWQNSSPFFRRDWSKKPAYDVYTNLIFGEWWTNASGSTDKSGHYRTQAFLGDYEITATAAGKSTTITTSLTDPSTETVVINAA